MNLLDTLLPSLCVGCNKLGPILCPNCRSGLEPRLRKVERGVIGIAALDYDDVVMKTINAFKERGRSALLSEFNIALDLLPVPPGAVLVGLPSSASATRRRGFVPAELLAERLARRRGAKARSALVFSRKVSDQSSLARADRESNLAGSMLARPVDELVVLVDDVVTTGASIREAERAMKAAGNQVLGFLTIAETLLKTD